MTDSPHVLYLVIGILVVAVAVLYYQLGKRTNTIEIDIKPPQIDSLEFDRLVQLIATPTLAG
jgi:hypothetical protein